jgi:small-conductance mechanosensitive channel
MRISRGKGFKYLALCLCSLLLIFVWSTPVWGQLIDLKGIFKQSSHAHVQRIGNIDVAIISLDGRNLFRVAAKAPESSDQDVTPIEWRVQEIKFNLNNLIKNGFDPNTLQVSTTSLGKQTVIEVKDQTMKSPQTILTITKQDALIDTEENTIPTAAQRRAKIIETALKQAWQERQPNYRWQQLSNSALVLLVMGIGVAVLGLLQHYRSRRYQRRLQHHQQQVAATLAQQNSEEELTSAPHTEEAASTRGRWLSLPSLNWEQQELINRSIRYFLAVLQLTILFFGSAWIFGRFPETRPLSRWLGTLPLSLILIPIAVILVKGIVDWIIVLSLDRLVELREATQTPGNRFQLRVQTVLNTLQDLTNYMAWLIGLLLFFIVINALPIGLILLAIVALASQNLLKDWLRGALILIEDHYAKGDIVMIGSIIGTVEFMNLRVTQLRTIDGKLVSIDNGSFTQAENLTSSWSGIKLTLDVAYQTNLDEAKKIIGEIAQEMEKDPDWEQYLIASPQILGVDAFGDNSIQIALLIKTQPGKQWEVGREYRRRLKPAFDQAGISIPFPQRSIWFENALPAKPLP